MKVVKKSAEQPNLKLQQYNTASTRLIFLLKLLGSDTIFSQP